MTTNSTIDPSATCEMAAASTTTKQPQELSGSTTQCAVDGADSGGPPGPQNDYDNQQPEQQSEVCKDASLSAGEDCVTCPSSREATCDKSVIDMVKEMSSSFFNVAMERETYGFLYQRYNSEPKLFIEDIRRFSASVYSKLSRENVVDFFQKQKDLISRSQYFASSFSRISGFQQKILPSQNMTQNWENAQHYVNHGLQQMKSFTADGQIISNSTKLTKQIVEYIIMVLKKNYSNFNTTEKSATFTKPTALFSASSIINRTRCVLLSMISLRPHKTTTY